MSRPMQHLCSTLPLLPIAARLSVPLGRTGRGFCWLLLLAMIVAPGFAQYSGVDGCIPGPCANATPCRHCSGRWSGNLGDTWNITTSMLDSSVAGSGSVPNPVSGCPAFTFQISSASSTFSPTGGTYPFIPGTTYMTIHANPSPGGQSCGGYTAVSVTLTIQVRNDGCDIAAGSAQNDDGSFYYSYYSMAKPAELPTGESTTAVGWGSGTYQTVQQFRQILQGPWDHPFDGRQVTEVAGSDKSDSCFYDGAAQRGYKQFGVTGGWWIVGRYATPPSYPYSNYWIDDYVGMLTDLVTFYRDNGKAPCSAYAEQLMRICTNGQGCSFTQQYFRNYLTYSLDATNVTASRNGVYQSRVWP
jgi:hypothetical protein